MPLAHTVHELVLQNGSRGLLIDVPKSTVVSYEIHFRAGGDYAPRDREQTAHIMEHMAFGATKTITSVEDFSQEFRKNGAYYNASTWHRNMSYYADCALMEWDRILHLEGQAIAEPRYTQKILDSEKGNVREELVGYANNDARVMWEQIYRAMGDDEILDTESLATLDAVTLADVKKHHQLTHATKNMRFIVAGDLETHEQAIIDELSSWPLTGGERLPVKQTVLHQAAATYIYRADSSNVRFGFSIVLNRILKTEEIDAMSALNHILTGTFHSRIFGKARTLGICYGMGSSTYTDIEGTARWEFYGQVSHENAAELFSLIVRELQKILDGNLKEEELNEAKSYALGSHQMRGQTVGQLARWYNDYVDDRPLEYLDDAPEKIKNIRRSTIRRVATEFIKGGLWSVGTIGNNTEAESQEYSRVLQRLFGA